MCSRLNILLFKNGTTHYYWYQGRGEGFPKILNSWCHANDPSFQMPWMKNGIYMYWQIQLIKLNGDWGTKLMSCWLNDLKEHHSLATLLKTNSISFNVLPRNLPQMWSLVRWWKMVINFSTSRHKYSPEHC